MTEKEFWSLIDSINKGAGGDNEAKQALLKKKLEAMDAASVAAFDNHLRDMMDKAYRWPLWAAAYIIDGGCSDDAFVDFRSTLIFMGRKIFEGACASPDSLAELDDDVLEEMFHEGLLYVAPEVYEAKAESMPERKTPSPQEPAGDPWDEDDDDRLRMLCPELMKRFWD